MGRRGIVNRHNGEVSGAAAVPLWGKGDVAALKRIAVRLYIRVHLVAVCIANTKYQVPNITGHTRDKLLEQWVHLTNHTAGHSRPPSTALRHTACAFWGMRVVVWRARRAHSVNHMAAVAQATEMNECSSRAHTIVVLSLSRARGGALCSSQLHLVDLAGSERAKTSRATVRARGRMA